MKDAKTFRCFVKPGPASGPTCVDLRTFLLSHITQAEDNCRLRAILSEDGSHYRSGRSFYGWVRGVSAGAHCIPRRNYESLVRDAEEHTLNSVNFPEFSRRPKTIPAYATTPSPAPDGAKSDLLWIAEYERHGLDKIMKLLEEELGPCELVDALRVFVDVTDLYGQIYVLKDIGTRTQ
ncbi:putative ent-kaurene synthase [Rosellinia necatrix]|uniref:Putative ent-kaurene synthase n=1 Tax=Rosellinia necatrix TaxID=77044 RepID=A0A1S8AA61_ROSNE|nr:putative ent-kaurene synthase [Rosellinia necatrix]